MENRIVYCFLICLLMSCHKIKKEEEIRFEKVINIECIQYKNEIITIPPVNLISFNTDLFIVNPDGEHLAKVITQKDASEKGSIGKIGSGPGEFISPYCSGISEKQNNIFFYDQSLKVLREFHFDNTNTEITLINESYFRNDSTSITNLHRLENDFSVASVVIGQDQPLVLLDKKLHIIQNFGRLINQPSKSKDLISYIGYFSSFGNKFVYIMQDLGYIACFEIKKNKATKLWDHFFESPVYDDFGSLDKKKLAKGFYDVKMTKNYIFCTYSGKKQQREQDQNINLLPETIFVFDHSGNPKVKIHTNRDIGRFTVLEDESTIYAVGAKPEVEVVRYNISGFI